MRTYPELQGFDAEQFVTELNRESARQVEKFGLQSHTIAEWALIASEEFGEAMREACELQFAGPDTPTTAMRSRLYDEIIQTATVLLKMAEAVCP